MRERERERERSLLQLFCMDTYTKIIFGSEARLVFRFSILSTEKLEIILVESCGLTLQTLRSILIIVLVTSREAELRFD